EVKNDDKSDSENGDNSESDDDESDKENVIDNDTEDKDVNEEDTNTVNVAAKNKYNDKNNTRTTSQTVEDEYYHDSSDEEDIRNTVGNIPMEWYRDYPHIGYDVEGRKLIKPKKGDELDEFLQRMDNPDYWRTVTNKMTGQNVLLTKEDVSLIEGLMLQRTPGGAKETYEASIGCTLCKFLIQEIDNFIVQNQSSTAINASVYVLCSKLPAPLDKLCCGYAPVIVQDVVSGFDPKQTCDKFKLCTNGSLSYQKSQLEFTEDFKDLECTQYAPMIVKDVTLGFDPEQTCEKVQLCTNGSFVQPFFEEVVPKELVEEKVEADAKCELCEFVVQLLDQYLASNKTTAAVNSSVMQICNLLPGSLKGQCILFAPQVVTMVTSGVAPENACKQAKLCLAVNGPFFQKELTELSCGQCHGIVEFLLPQKYNPEFGNLICKAACPVARRRRSVDETPQIFLEFMKAAKITRTWRCDLCEWIIEAINAYVQTNVTEQSLEDYMNDVCHFMPEPFKDECMKSVPEIIKELSHGFDEDVLCQHYIPDECNGSFVAAVDKPVAVFFDEKKKDKDAQCEICKQIIKYIDGNLNHDKNEVKMYVDDVCERLPSPTKKACKSFAAAEMEEILLKIINKILSPEDVCHMITVC
ncbi:ribosome biogenesis protein ERB1, partial [Mytilus galloprovincialis]